MNPLDKLNHFVTSVGTFVDNGLRIVPKEVFDERMRICRDCPLSTQFTCRECSCLLQVKLQFPHEQCPLDPPKWLAVDLFISGVPLYGNMSHRCGTCNKEK